MKKSIVSTLVTLTALQLAYGQMNTADVANSSSNTNANANTNSALSSVVPSTTATVAPSSVSTGDSAATSKSQAENVVIVNQTQTADLSAAQLQKQPVTVVEASPLSVSRAEELRKAREAVEMDTEQKIAERLERARMEDERKRQQAILGNINNTEIKNEVKVEQVEKVEVVQPVQPVQQPVVVVTPPPAPAAEVVMKEEVEKPQTGAKEQTLGLSLGMLDYDSYDVETFGAVGVSGGWIYPTNFAIDLNFGYSSNNISEDIFLYRTMDQFSFGLTGRYVFLGGRTIRPSIGAAMAYVYRDYSELSDAYGYPVYAYPQDFSSSAIDWGFVAGVDFRVSEQFSVGFEYRYMTNLTYKFDGDEFMNTSEFRNSYGNYGSEPLEARDYTLMSGVLKYVF